MIVLKHFAILETLFFFLRVGKMAYSWLCQRVSLGLQKTKKANKQNQKLVSLYFVGVIDLKLIAD